MNAVGFSPMSRFEPLMPRVQVSYADGARLWSTGDPADSVLYITSGVVAVGNADIARSVLLREGDFFGTQALEPVGPHEAAPVRQVGAV